MVLMIKKKNIFCTQSLPQMAIITMIFSRHARRTTINCDDVKLLVRRNSHLVSYRVFSFTFYLSSVLAKDFFLNAQFTHF